MSKNARFLSFLLSVILNIVEHSLSFIIFHPLFSGKHKNKNKQKDNKKRERKKNINV